MSTAAVQSLRDADAARAWIAAGLEVLRVGPDDFSSASALIRTAASECAAVPPVGVLVDLGRLLQGQRVRTVPGPRHVAEVMRRYDDQVLGRIAVHPLAEDLTDALASLPEALRPVAISLVVEAMLDRVGFDERYALAPEALEDLDRQDAGAWRVRGASAVRELSEELIEAYQELLACFGRAAEAITASEVTLVERLTALRGRADRLALIQLVDVAAQLREGLPRTVRAGRRHQGHVPTITEDTSSYPVGGFSSITTRGSMENLVPSELAGMEDGEEIDLFDVRYTENELLYYTRDESAFVRSTRFVFVVLHGSLDRLRHRDRALPYQARILAFGLVRALVLQLERWLSAHALYLTIVWPEEGLDEDERILGVALAQQLHGGWVRFTRTHDESAMEDCGKRAPTDVIHLAADDEPVIPVEKTWTSVFHVATTPVLQLPRGTAPLPDEPWAAWCAAFETLARDLV